MGLLGPTSRNRKKAVRLPIRAYNKLLELKQKEIERVAEEEKDPEKLNMLISMDDGTFLGYLIYKLAWYTERVEEIKHT